MSLAETEVLLLPRKSTINASIAPFWSNEIAAFEPDYSRVYTVINDLISLVLANQGAVILSYI